MTISNTIANESSAIGTLRASGYTKGELIRHYLSMPVIVTFLAAVVGNILGYTVFKDVVVGMYYNSYSLPTYHTIWNPGAFIKTTLAPVIIMLVVNLIVIIRMMQHTPLQFLRHDLKKTKRKKSNAASALELHEPFQTENHVPECGKLSDTFCGNIFHHGNARDGSRHAGYT